HHRALLVAEAVHALEGRGPGGDEVPVAVHRHAGVVIAQVGGGELDRLALGRAGGAVALRVEHKGVVVRGVHVGHDEVAGGVHGHVVGDGPVLDQEFAGAGVAVAVVEPGLHVVAALPGDHEVAVGVRRDAGVSLAAGGGRVDPEFGPAGRAVGPVALGEDAVGVAR